MLGTRENEEGKEEPHGIRSEQWISVINLRLKK